MARTTCRTSRAIYRTQAKNAQEAHEAIRPTDMFRRPARRCRAISNDEQRGLYELIWKRAVASQMAAALIDQVAVDIAPADGKRHAARHRLDHRVRRLPRALSRGSRTIRDEDEEAGLPPLKERDALNRGDGRARSSTSPSRRRATPRRAWSRSSRSWASAALRPTPRSCRCCRTANMCGSTRSASCRRIAAGSSPRSSPASSSATSNTASPPISRTSSTTFPAAASPGGRCSRNSGAISRAAVDGTKDLNITQVIAALDEVLGRHFFPDDGSGHDPRLCPACAAGPARPEARPLRRLHRAARTIPNAATRGRWGWSSKDGAEGAELAAGPRALGNDPASGEGVTLRKGPYGIYVQLGEGEKPKRSSLPKGMSPADVTLESALKLLSLPREIGPHPEDGEPIVAGIGRFGPYVRHGKTYKSLAADDDVLVIGLNRAVSLLAEPRTGRGGRQPLRVVGNHPADGAPINLYSGRYGPYVSHGGDQRDRAATTSSPSS